MPTVCSTKASFSASAISKVVRAAAGQPGSHYPIKIEDGFAAPRLAGDGCYWTTPSGRPVYHPNAYRRAWGKTVYHCSTLEIVVGAGWVTEALLAPGENVTKKGKAI